MLPRQFNSTNLQISQEREYVCQVLRLLLQVLLNQQEILHVLEQFHLLQYIVLHRVRINKIFLELLCQLDLHSIGVGICWVDLQKILIHFLKILVLQLVNILDSKVVLELVEQLLFVILTLRDGISYLFLHGLNTLEQLGVPVSD